MSIRPLKSLLAGLSLVACTSAFAGPMTVQVAETYNVEFTDFLSTGVAGDPANDVEFIFVGANATITSLSYLVTTTAFSTSYLSQMSLLFSSTAGMGLAFRPAGGQDFAGTVTNGNSIDLVASGQTFKVGSDGLLRLEFFETLDDFAGPDGVWNSGILSFGVQTAEAAVPEPATGMLMGAGLLLMGYASRRRRTRSGAV